MILSDRFIKALPSGIKPEHVRIIDCIAVAQPQDLTEQEKLVVASVTDKASVPLINPEGKPTVMKVVAWMAHEGVNRNRQGFVKAELEALAPTLFRAPDFGVMDWNHSAVALFSDDPKLIGIWYNASFAFDEKAQKWGIIATGMLFSWLFPEQANSLLADETRLGSMRFSMACIPDTIEISKDEKGSFEILHNPVFFTVSALDVAPADPNAVGLGSEDPDQNVETIRQRLLNVANTKPWQKLLAAKMQGEPMDELIKELTEARIKAEREAGAITEKFSQAEKSLTSATEALETMTSEVAALKAKAEGLQASFDDSAAKYAELETARDAAIAERDALKEQVAALTLQVEELTKVTDQVAAEAEDTARKATLEARIAALPESYRKAHLAKPEEKRTLIEARWISKTAEEWDAFIKEDLAGFAPQDIRVSFLQRTEDEGVRLPATKGAGEDFARFLRN